MQLLRLIVVVVATLAVVGQYLQELHRLSVIKQLPGERARAFYESTRERSERMLTVLTAVLAAGALAAATYVFVLR